MTDKIINEDAERCRHSWREAGFLWNQGSHTEIRIEPEILMKPLLDKSIPRQRE